MEIIDLVCISVGGGWQSAVKGTNVVFGPVFNKIQDLWKWQRDNSITFVQL